MERVASGSYARSRLRKHRRRTSVCCPYCRQRWGPWTGQVIEPCQACRRPLFLLRRLNRRTHPDQVSSVLDTINGLQGVVVIAALAALMLDWIAPRQLARTFAMALFVAASAYTTDGVLGLRSGILRIFTQVIVERQAQIASVAKIATGLVAFGLSFFGIFLFGGRP